MEVPGDRASLVELLVILLDNSIKYSEGGTTITVSTRGQKRHALIAVTDQGFGISPEDLQHVFDRFYRGKFEDPARHVEGYGLGLSIARRIAEMHRGAIDIVSAPGAGTTVTVRLPRSHQARTEPEKGAGQTEQEAEPTTRKT